MTASLAGETPLLRDKEESFKDEIRRKETLYWLSKDVCKVSSYSIIYIKIEEFLRKFNTNVKSINVVDIVAKET